MHTTGITLSGYITTTTRSIVDTTGNSLVIGTGCNKWLFHT